MLWVTRQERQQAGVLALPLPPGSPRHSFFPGSRGPGPALSDRQTGLSHDKETPRGCCQGAARRAIPGAAGFAARRCTPRRTPGSNPDCATVSRMTRRRAIAPFWEAGRDVHPYPTEKPGGYCRRFARRQAAAARRRGTGAHHGPPGMAGPGPHERGRPRPAPGMRSPARTQREPRPRWRVKQALQAQPPHPARVRLHCLPVSPMPRRTATASRHSPLPARRIPDAPSPQARRHRSLHLSPPARRRTKAPPTDRRGHEAMAVGAESGGQRARTQRQARQCRKSARVYGRAELGLGFPQL